VKQTNKIELCREFPKVKPLTITARGQNHTIPYWRKQLERTVLRLTGARSPNERLLNWECDRFIPLAHLLGGGEELSDAVQ
jgi:hypothetical protein